MTKGATIISLYLLHFFIDKYKLEFINKEWSKTGDVKIDMNDKKAILLINNYNPKQTNIEAIVIHELLHIKLYGLDQMIEKLLYCVYGDDETNPKFSFAYAQFMGLLEQTTEDLAKGYKDLGATDKTISFGRIQKILVRVESPQAHLKIIQGRESC